MNDAQTARLVTELCLAEDRPLADALVGFAPGPAGSARSGKLAKALGGLGYQPALAKVGAAWPPALKRAAALCAQLPPPSVLRVPLTQTCAWFALIAAVQSGVLAVLQLKVLPTFTQMSSDLKVPGPLFTELAQELLSVAVPLLLVLAIFGAARISWLPGWGRRLRAAQEAAATAALLQTAAPPDVFGVWIRESKSLRALAVGPIAEDLLALSAALGQRSEQAMQRFVIFYRYLGFALFTLVALATTVDVYGLCAALSRSG